MKRILVIRFGSLGDVLLTSAAVLNLKLSFPESRLTFLTKERFAGIVAAFDGVDEVAALPEGSSRWAILHFLLNLDSSNFDTIVDLHGNLRSWLTRKLVTASATAVYPKRRIERMRLVKQKRIPESWPHTIDLYNEAVAAVGGSTPARRPLLIPMNGEAEPSISSSFFERPVVAIAPGAAHPNKQWPFEWFYETAIELQQSRDVGILWALTSADAACLPENRRHPADRWVELVDQPLLPLAGLLARCSVAIANDSGIAHLSSAVGTPVAAVFGPTHPALGFAPAGLFDRVIEVEEPCRPCSLHGKKPCYREERFCFTRIDVGMVAAQVRELLDRSVTFSPALFVDRDGTMIVDKDYLADPEQVEFEAGSIEALRLAQQHGYKIIIVSNQSGVARGYFEIDDVERVNARVLELLAVHDVEVDAVYYCPHHADGSVPAYTTICDCRKPAAGMAEQAATEIGIDLRRSWVVGDKIDDVSLARVIGGRGCLVRTGYGRREKKLFATQELGGRHLIADNLLAAVKVITGSEGK